MPCSSNNNPIGHPMYICQTCCACTSTRLIPAKYGKMIFDPTAQTLALRYLPSRLDPKYNQEELGCRNIPCRHKYCQYCPLTELRSWYWQCWSCNHKTFGHSTYLREGFNSECRECGYKRDGSCYFGFVPKHCWDLGNAGENLL